MEEKDIIFLGEQEESFVLVERNKKRQKQKQREAIKRGVAFIVLIVAIIGAIKIFPYVKEFFSSFKNENPPADSSGINKPSDDGSLPPSLDTSTDTSTDASSDEDTSTSEEENSDSDTETDTDTNENNEFKTDFYEIKENGTSKYLAINESGCEFDFSKDFSKTKLKDIQRKYGSDAPIVLITHSSINESYSNGENYSKDGDFYSEKNNVGDIGKIICNNLNALGVGAIQLDELYASGAIFSSQAEYKKSLDEALKKYPSISYVFNVSRGISLNDDLTMNKSTFQKDGEKYAQISMISGTNWDSATKNQTQNVLFAFDFSKYLNNESPNFVKENKISRYSLSQDISPNTVNIDIGEFSNSFEEAKRSAVLFATLFYNYITN